jgi:hypothetical protein
MMQTRRTAVEWYRWLYDYSPPAAHMLRNARSPIRRVDSHLVGSAVPGDSAGDQLSVHLGKIAPIHPKRNAAISTTCGGENALPRIEVSTWRASRTLPALTLTTG